jgi:hypothetical protein
MKHLLITAFVLLVVLICLLVYLKNSNVVNNFANYSVINQSEIDINLVETKKHGIDQQFESKVGVSPATKQTLTELENELNEVDFAEVLEDF